MRRRTTTTIDPPRSFRPGDRVLVTWAKETVKGTIEGDAAPHRRRVRLLANGPIAIVEDRYLLPDDAAPEIPEWLIVPLDLHDRGECGCPDDPCCAGLWDDGRIDTETARKRMGVEA